MRQKAAYRLTATSSTKELVRCLSELQDVANRYEGDFNPQVVYVSWVGTPQEYVTRATLYVETLSDGSKVYEIEMN